jgi:hypothetical protein
VVNDDYGHVAMPKLYGAPAYARPPITPVEPVERPLDPDDLPLASEQTDDERAMIQGLGDGSGNGTASTDLAAASNATAGGGRRSFSLRGLSGFVRRDRNTTTDVG